MIKPSRAWMQALQYTKQAEGETLLSRLPALIATHAERPALIGATTTLTYRELGERVELYARWALAHDLAGRTVGLIMENSPEYVALWLGLTRVGCTVALLNTNLQRRAIEHSLKVAEAAFVVTSPGFVSRCLGEGRPVWVVTPAEARAAGRADRSLETIPLPSANQTALYIYTSGTTGLPKATRITHARIAEWSYWFAGIMDAQATDRLYNCLPMYHSIGGVTAVGSMLVQGGSVVIRERFSASQFWNDVASTECTIFQYIGELCRYLTAFSARPCESQHKLRLAVGNGLQQDVWKAFQSRFRIPQILEFYAATEGGLSLYNCEGKPGSIGRVPPLLAERFAAAIVRCDPQTGDLLRDSCGLCQVATVGEVGEALGRLGPSRRFDGYTDTAASEGKIVRDVLAHGDAWFRTGDLMRRDAQGYYYFVDRSGDTFRWKGENVSSTEIAQVLRCCPGVVDVAVFGVEVAEADGRAGMAAIVVNAEFHFDGLLATVQAHLPAYAWPLYVRLCQRLDITGTFKLVTYRLAEEGVEAASDPVWHLVNGQYQRLAVQSA